MNNITPKQKTPWRNYVYIHLPNWFVTHKNIFKNNPNQDLNIEQRQLLLNNIILALKKFAANFHQFTPLVALDPSLTNYLKNQKTDLLTLKNFGIILNTTGMQSLFIDLEHYCCLIKDFLNSKNIASQIGAADTPIAARALALSSDLNFQYCNLKESIKNLSIQTLLIPKEQQHELNYFGLNLIGDLLGIRPKELAKRSGLDLINLLNECLGHTPGKLKYIFPHKKTWISRSFKSQINSREPIVKAVALLTLQLHQQLVQQGLIAQRFLCLLYNNHEPVAHKYFSLYRTFYTEKEVNNLLTPLLERLVFYQAIDRIKIEALMIRKITKEQLSSFEDTYASEKLELNEFLQLAKEFCGDNILFADCHENYLPENNYTLTSLKPVKRGFNSVLFKERPSTFIYPAQEIKAIALLPENAPNRIFWNSTEYIIVRGLGPEKISENWWKTLDADGSLTLKVREYFKVLTKDGLWLWIYRVKPDYLWFLQGFWG